MSSNSPTILIADDEIKYVNSLTAILKASGYDVVSAFDGNMAMDVAKYIEPALILLDICMPGIDGFETCRRIREISQAPIIMLTALSQKSDIVRGLEAGADDYLTKPFSADELLARIQAALRREGYPRLSPTQLPFQSGGLSVDYIRKQVFIDGKEISLSPVEYLALCELTRAAGHIVSLDTLAKNVWGKDRENERQLSRYMMERLCSKIEADTNHPRFIHAQSGSAYMFEKQTATPFILLSE
jgi:two-component system KDP operon response regulator KdpE